MIILSKINSKQILNILLFKYSFIFLIPFLINNIQSQPTTPPGTFSETGTFVNSNFGIFSLTADGQLLFSAGSNGATDYQAAIINPNQTGTFSNVLSSAQSSNNSSYSIISPDGYLGMAVTLNVKVSLLIDLFNINPSAKTIARIGTYQTTSDADYVEEIAISPNHNFSVVTIYKVATNGSISGYLYTFYPEGNTVKLGTQLNNKNGKFLDFDISPDGTKLAVVQVGKGTIEIKIYSVNQTNAALTEIASYSRSADYITAAAIEYHPDQTYLFMTIAKDGYLFSFSATQTGTLTPITTLSNVQLVKNGQMIAGKKIILILGELPSNTMFNAVNIYQINANGSLAYQGTFVPETATPPLLLDLNASRNTLALTSDDKIGVLIYKLNEGLSNVRCRLYSFDTSLSGDNYTALHTVTFIPGGQFTQMSICQNDTGNRIIAYPSSYVFGTAHILSLEQYTSPTPTPINTPTPTITPFPTSTNTPTPTLTPSATPSATPSLTPTKTSTPTPINTHTPTNTPTPIRSPTPTITPTITQTPTITYSPTPTIILSPTPTSTKTPTPTFTPTIIPSSTPSPIPTQTQTPTQTLTPTPSNTPTPIPSSTPTNIPTPSPTSLPTIIPTTTPSPTPTATYIPTTTSTATPTSTPIQTLTATPTPTPYITITPLPTKSATPTPTITIIPTPSPYNQANYFYIF